MTLAILIPANLDLPLTVFDFDGPFDYQFAIGGHIEPISVEDPHMCLYTKHGGKTHGLPMNSRATALWWIVSPHLRGRDELVGDVIVTGRATGDEFEASAPNEILDLLMVTEHYKVEVQTSYNPTEWFDSTRRFENFFTAATYALELDLRWYEITGTRITAA